jgi:hypothetical protein
MANKVVLEAEVKSNIGEVSKDAGSLAGEFKVMGVSLNSVKAGFVSVGNTAKASFATIKAGIMSTGIGALLIAVTSLISYFTNTKRGADQLSQAFTAMGATVDVLTDRFSRMGEIITLVFSGKFKEAGEVAKGIFSGITDEIGKEVDAMVALKQRTQDLRDADNEFMIQKAATRQEIEKARLIAEDETKSAKERLDNLTKALELEEKTTKRELELATERLAIQEEEMALSENSAEDEARLAQLKVELIEKETASVKMRRRVVTEVNSLEREIAAEEKSRRDETKIELTAMDNMFEQSINKKIELLGELAKAEDINFEKKKTIEMSLQELSEKRIEWAAMTENERLNVAKNTLNDLTKIAGEETETGRALAITATTIDTYQSAMASYKSLSGIPVVGPVLGGIAAAAAIAMGLKNIQAIKSASSSGGVDGGVNIPSGGDLAPQTPAPQMMSGAFDLTGGVAPEPVRAFVVTDEMTSSQNQLANIRRRATI